MANGRRHGNRDTQFGPERLRARAIDLDPSAGGLHQGAQPPCCRSDAVYMAATDQPPEPYRALAPREPSIHGPSDNGADDGGRPTSAGGRPSLARRPGWRDDADRRSSGAVRRPGSAGSALEAPGVSCGRVESSGGRIRRALPGWFGFGYHPKMASPQPCVSSRKASAIAAPARRCRRTARQDNIALKGGDASAGRGDRQGRAAGADRV